MKVRILSDLHLEHADWKPPQVRADVVVLAGDIHVGTHGLAWARRHFPETEVIYVAGNHEYYGGHLQEVLAALREQGRAAGIHVLERDEVTLGGVRFLGGTLWTDFALHGADSKSLAQAMRIAETGMNDFRKVRYGPAGLLRAWHTRLMHLEQVQWLHERLTAAAGSPTVVVSHHLPHSRSVSDRFVGNPYSPAFASDLDWLVRSPVSLWIHGHTHDSAGYEVHGTRVVCNPRGYIPYEPNEGFDPQLTVEVCAEPAVEA